MNNISIVGVSGGPDSMALLDQLRRQHKNCVVVHVNYQKRESAYRDQQLVEAYCQKHKLICVCFLVEDNFAGNFQDEARRYRFKKYKEVYDAYQAKALYLGHHLDDQLETILFQLVTHRQVSYLGIKRRVWVNSMCVIRPLLNQSKTALVQYCNDHQIAYGHDETNDELTYTRNILRQILKTMLHNDKQALLLYQQKENQKNKKTAKKIDALLRKSKNSLKSSILRKNPDYQNSLVREFLKRNQLNVHKMSGGALADLTHKILSQKHQVIHFSEETVGVIQYDSFTIITVNDYQFTFTFDKIRHVKTPFFQLSKDGTKPNGLIVHPDDFPITIRNTKPGDKILMKYGHKKVARFFIDQKISYLERLSWPVVENCHQEIIFVYGLGGNHCHQSTHHTLFMLK